MDPRFYYLGVGFGCDHMESSSTEDKSKGADGIFLFAWLGSGNQMLDSWDFHQQTGQTKALRSPVILVALISQNVGKTMINHPWLGMVYRSYGDFGGGLLLLYQNRKMDGIAPTSRNARRYAERGKIGYTSWLD